MGICAEEVSRLEANLELFSESKRVVQSLRIARNIYVGALAIVTECLEKDKFIIGGPNYTLGVITNWGLESGLCRFYGRNLSCNASSETRLIWNPKMRRAMRNAGVARRGYYKNDTGVINRMYLFMYTNPVKNTPKIRELCSILKTTYTLRIELINKLLKELKG